jgi:hypothetical protein
MRWTADADPAVRARTASLLVPLRPTRDQAGRWTTTGTILYASTLFSVHQVIQASGLVEMTDDQPLLHDLPVLQDYFAGGVRLTGDADTVRVQKAEETLASKPDDAEALRTLARSKAQRKAWTEAVSLQRRRIDALSQNAKAGTSLVGEYVSLSWYQLFARDFAGALASTDEGKRLDGSDLAIDTNRAHALLFLGRVRDAEALYLTHRGKPISAGSKRLWEEVILDDFDQLAAAHITAPAMKRIRDALGGVSASRHPPS